MVSSDDLQNFAKLIAKECSAIVENCGALQSTQKRDELTNLIVSMKINEAAKKVKEEFEVVE